MPNCPECGALYEPEDYFCPDCGARLKKEGRAHRRRRATAIVEISKGILLVSHSRGRHPTFMLPGGGVKNGERSMSAIIRELYEETGLHALKVKYLFSLKTKFHKHKVFLIKAKGNLRKRHEVKHIAFWNKKTKHKLRVSGHVKSVLKKFKKLKHGIHS